MSSDRDPGPEPVPGDPRRDAVDLPVDAPPAHADVLDVPLYATAEEVAYAAELAALDRAEDAVLRAE